jgi:ferric-dicitrate binding protein FerR (iron transport regulator)
VDRIASVKWSSGNVKLGHEVAGGALTLEDGTALALQGQHRAAVIQSFYQPSGSLYSVVRVLPGRFGTLAVQVRPGGRLDLFTPAAIVTTLGTRFEVTTTIDGGTVVEVLNGSVNVVSFDGKSVTLYRGNKAKVAGTLSAAWRNGASIDSTLGVTGVRAAQDGLVDFSAYREAD